MKPLIDIIDTTNEPDILTQIIDESNTMKKQTRKQNLQQRLSVKWIGSGHYEWTLKVKDSEYRYTSTDSMLYDKWKSNEDTLDDLNHIAKMCRMYGSIA